MNKESRILSVRNMEVKFQVRGKFLTAIRNVDLDVYDGEILAIVGESGSGKSVITKTFTGMLESNGWVSNGSIVYRPTQETIADEKSYFKEPIDLVNLQSPLIAKDVIKTVLKSNKLQIKTCLKSVEHIYKLNPKFSDKKSIKLELDIFRLSERLEHETEEQKIDLLKEQISELNDKLNSKTNDRDALESQRKQSKEKLEARKLVLQEKIKTIDSSADFSGKNSINKKVLKLESKIKSIDTSLKIVEDASFRDERVNEIYSEILKHEIDVTKINPLNMGQRKNISKIILLVEKFIETKEEWSKEEKEVILEYFASRKHLKRFELELDNICQSIMTKQTVDQDHFYNILIDWKRIKHSDVVNKIKALKEIRQLRGKTISTVFQDPMTSLNPLLPVGFQIMEVLRKQLGMSKKDAKAEAIELLRKVGITNPEKRIKDIPGRYSGGMRQRVVIAIALACRPKVLICDEPTTALDVTIQAQILNLIKELKEEYKFTVIFITHDLGVVAKIADRVAVMYAGQIVEVATVDEIFENSKHPYTWALLSSLPQLGKKGEELYSIEGTPPSLFNEIQGDAFAPRNRYAMELDYVKEPPMFKVSETHFAKTWLLDPRAPKVERPAILNKLKETIREAEKVG
ncbi:oligopeptide transport system ATP-binding protein [Spiroplasma chinense]|uniref:Oligopeptide transport system ATP-binding protein n=1 Tax=Spiroplasma chinense TaxID=216932 RepID=A0A5B9Y5X1_9MOLU|nr:oligopeptide ABC transporter ATP-binding protein OppD [Spiroplasma chinense]QEH62099.1 oligopeptide transport system ATP-binding protein [Spiroplasma chinense]